MQSTRTRYCDIAKAIAIICVVVGHIVDKDTICKTAVYSFHMPLFFLLSGMFIHTSKVTTNWISFLNFEAKKFRSLIVPYFIWAFFYSSVNVRNFLLIGYGSWQSLGKAGSLTSLWFLPVLFLAVTLYVCLSSLFRFITNNLIRQILPSVLLLLLSLCIFTSKENGCFWGWNIAISASFFVSLGPMVNKCSVLVEKLSWKSTFLLLLSLCFLFSYTYSNGLPSCGYVRMADASYGNAFFYIVNALLGSTIVLVFSFLISKVKVESFVCELVGKNTLGIFLVHKLVIKSLIQYTGIYSCIGNTVLDTLLFSIVVLLLSLFIVLVINRVAPFLLNKI